MAPDAHVRDLPLGLGEACSAIARAVADSLDLGEVINRVATAARLVVPFDAMGIWHAAAPDDPLSLIAGPGASSRVGPADRPLRRSDHSPKLWPDASGLPACIADAPAELDPGYAGDRIVIDLGFRSVLVLGLASGSRNLGVLWFLKRESAMYAPERARLLQPVVDLTTLAVEHTQLQSLSEERRVRREALEALLPTLAGALDVQAVFAQVSEVIQRVIPHDHMTLGLVSPDGQGIRFHASSRGTISPEIPEYRPKTDYGAASLEWDSFIVRDYLRLPEGMLRVEFWDPRTRQIRTREYRPDPVLYRSYEERGVRAELRMPIWLQGERVGYLFFFSRQPNSFSEDDVDLARRVADHLALAIAHERLAAEARRADQAQEQATRLQERVDSLAEELKGVGPHRALGRSREWRDVLGQATKVAVTDTTVLVTGESGTGKEVVARFIHRASRRAERPFVALNCAALPEQLLESELFGHERGAFTGAYASRPGKVEQASGGILFLDEVAEMTPSVQAKFLRLLQEREFQRLGGTQTLRADVRVIAATNRDPRMAMERGILREDLYYRLSAFEITLPPLRERPDDILVLAEAFLDEIGRTVGRARRGALEGRARSAPGSRLAGQYQRAAQRDRARRHPVRGRADHGRAPADHPDRAEAHSPAGAVRAGGRGGACRDESLDPDRGRQPRRGRARSHPEGDGPGPEQQVGRGEASRPAPGPALLTPQAPRPRSREGLAGARFCSTCPLLVTLRPWGRAHESRPKTSI